MPDTKVARKKIEKALNQLFKDRGQQLASIGTGTETDKLPEFNQETGTWENKGLASKPPRYLLQLRVKDGKVEVGNFFPNNITGKVGAFNGIMRDFKGVPGVLLRLHLIVAYPDNTFYLLTDWEWLVLLLFPKAIVGATSSDAITNFLPPKATITFLGKELPLAAVQLFGLIPDDEEVILPAENDTEATFSYQAVTSAIQEYLTIDYTDTPSEI